MAEVTIDTDGHLLLIGVNRPEANNLWNTEVIRTVSQAYKRLADDEDLRIGVVYGHGKHFTAGLDLASVAPLVASAMSPLCPAAPRNGPHETPHGRSYSTTTRRSSPEPMPWKA